MSEIKNKILNGIELTSEDFFSILWGEVEDVEVVESIIEEEQRWSVLKKVIFKTDERFFRVYCDSGATEYQEDEFFEQSAVEVEKKEIKTYIWIPKES